MKIYNLLSIKQNNKQKRDWHFSITAIPRFPFGHREHINYAFNANFVDLLEKKKVGAL